MRCSVTAQSGFSSPAAACSTAIAPWPSALPSGGGGERGGGALIAGTGGSGTATAELAGVVLAGLELTGVVLAGAALAAGRGAAAAAPSPGEPALPRHVHASSRPRDAERSCRFINSLLSARAAPTATPRSAERRT